jgi:hypothetical protein
MTAVWCDACGVYMNKVEIGVITRVGENMVRRGDRYICPQCGKGVISDFGTAYEVKPK